MARFLRYCFVCLVSLSPLAISAERVIVVEPSQLQRTFSPGQGPYAFSDSKNWKEPVSTQSGRINLPVAKKGNFTFGTFRAGLKNALKVNPAAVAVNAAIAGALAGVGYLLDPENNSIQKPGDGVAPTPTATSYYWTRPGWGTQYQTPLAGCQDLATVGFGSGWYVSSVSVAADGLTAQCVIAGYYAYYQTFYRQGSDCPAGSIFDTNKGACMIPGAPVPVTDSELDTLISGLDASQAPLVVPDVISAVPGSYDYPDGTVFDGPESITGDPVVTTTTTPTGTEVSTTTPTYNFDYSTNPLSITTTTTNTTTVYNNGTLVSTSTTTNNQGVVDKPAPEKLDIPTDCEFMPTVCAWLDWFKSPAPPPNDPQLPEITDSFEKSYSGPSLSASCPPPFTVNTGAFGSILMPVQPLCDLAGLIKYLVLSAAGLLAAFIISGTRRA